ncbi:MAG: hypothetical protein AAFV86_20755 [Pseudomonadota bacterium]
MAVQGDRRFRRRDGGDHGDATIGATIGATIETGRDPRAAAMREAMAAIRGKAGQAVRLRAGGAVGLRPAIRA